MKRIAVVCAPGIGDGLILQIASYQLQQHGFAPTTFSDFLPRFGAWFNGFSFAPQPKVEEIEKTFSDFDAIFLQHDNSAKANKIRALQKPVYTFYGSHLVSKHGPLKLGFDFVADQNRTMVENVAAGVKTLFRLNSVGTENGLKAPPHLIHRKCNKRVAIHARSGKKEKTWPSEKFNELALWLKTKDLEPFFLPEFPTLEELCNTIYESAFFIGNDSGPAHIASYLEIPHLIIARSEKEMRFWQPGWMRGEVILPPAWTPNWKGFRLREKYWKQFVTTNAVIDIFENKVMTLV